MRILLFFAFLATTTIGYNQAVMATYSAGVISTSFNAYDPTCNGPLTTLTLTLPTSSPFYIVTKIDIAYDMEALSTGWMADQRSQVHCQNTSISEPVFSGAGSTSGIYSYDRDNVTIANGIFAGGTSLVFEMRAWRIFEGVAGCNNLLNRINNSTWNIIVYYEEDADMDGWSVAGGDCDDTNPNIYPGATELCGLVDYDCDGIIGDLDPDTNPSVAGGYDCYPDSDGDGYHLDVGGIGFYCNCPTGFIPYNIFNDIDCDDNNFFIRPGALEICDGIDNNCDGFLDDDNDGDGWSCLVDCDDLDPNIYPGATEQCGLIDYDCDGIIGDLDPDTNPITAGGYDCYPDTDGDGYHLDVGGIGFYCNCPTGFIPYNIFNDIDCDDNNFFIRPGALEFCDGIDNNCDGIIDDDFDGDGWNCFVDCDDNDPNVFPGAQEIACDGIDSDCDGADFLVDIDMDGFLCDVDCNDNNSLVNPGATEIVGNGIDDDCNGIVDEIDCFADGDSDGFGFGPATTSLGPCSDIGLVDNDLDCDDGNALIHPDADEICGNSVDEDCSNAIDDADLDNDGFDCIVDCDDSNANVYPGALEICDNGINDDCDGMTDEIEIGNPGVITCYEDLDMDLYGSLVSILACNSCPSGYVIQAGDCDDNNAMVNPGVAESCANGLDDDCNNIIDDPLIDNDADGHFCDTDCDDNNNAVYPDAPEIASNGIDDNCNGLIDEIGMDSDMDSVDDSMDNCINVPNPLQSDTDGDGIGDLCDVDFVTSDNIGIGTTTPTTKLHLKDGELFLDKSNSGVILKTTSNECYRLSLNASGTVITTIIDCPN